MADAPSPTATKAKSAFKTALNCIFNKWTLLAAIGVWLGGVFFVPKVMTAINTAVATGGSAAPLQVAAAPYTVGVPEMFTHFKAAAAGTSAAAPMPAPLLADPSTSATMWTPPGLGT